MTQGSDLQLNSTGVDWSSCEKLAFFTGPLRTLTRVIHATIQLPFIPQPMPLSNKAGIFIRTHSNYRQ